MIDTIKAIVGWSSLAFSIIGFVETAIGFKEDKSYNLLRVIVYCMAFGAGVGLVTH